jgi:hypothetical protein
MLGNLFFVVHWIHMDGLNILITTDIPEDANEKRQWKTNKCNVNLILKATLIEADTYQTLINNGWDLDKPNPKTTYDKVLIAIPNIAKDTVGVLIEEFTGIR